MSGLTSDVFDEHLVDESSQYMLDDLQLAAELGKTLLERNKELEATLKHHQNMIDDHAQEIEYLTKQNAALREVNDSRMKIYEQLEVSIQDLERDKYKLALEYQAEKKHVKQLCSNIESLETKVEELTRSLEDARRQAEADRRTKQTERLLGQHQQSPVLPTITLNSQTSHASKDAIPSAAPQEGAATNSRQTTEHCQPAKPMSVATAKRSEQAPSSTAATTADGGATKAEDGEESNQEDRDGGTGPDEHTLSEDNEEVLRIMQELERTQKSLMSEQCKVGELEEQLAAIAQENTALQSKLLNVHTTTETRSVHDELSMLEEFRGHQGQVCTRCLRDLGEQPDNDSIITGTDDDDASLMELIRNTEFPKVYRSAVSLEANTCTICAHSSKYLHELPVNVVRLLLELWLLVVRKFTILKRIGATKPDSLDLSASECAGPTNPYRELVEKYEALLDVHRQPVVRKATGAGTTATGSTGPTAAPAGSGNNTPVDSCQPQQLLADAVDMIPCGTAGPGDAPVRVSGTECSETETASSGYSDEVSNKATQTDESPRNFLCTIADGKDWRFSIYEDDSAIDSRFRFSPAHRELFREIFSVLRKAAENRDEGDQLPLLDDTKPGVMSQQQQQQVGRAGTNPVPPVTPANEEPPSAFGVDKVVHNDDEEEDEDDETVSFVSSSAVSEQSFAMSECITKSERRRIARQAKAAASRYADDEPKPLDGALGGEAAAIQQKQHPQPKIPTGLPGNCPLDYISVSVGVRKGKSRRRSHRRESNQSAGGAPPTPTPPRSGSARKNRPSFRPWNPERDGGAIATGAAGTNPGAEWNGDWTGGVYQRPKGQPGPPVATAATTPAANAPTPRSSRRSGEKKRNASGLRNRYADLVSDALGDEVVQFRPSPASQHLHKLQKLDLSYAEVLRRADGSHPFPARRQY
uniref:Cerebellar degeneration-related protein 2-like n=1 Tax=Anopheles epiroticus TaxID=199890 RepID=A0A182PT63_9DIPT